ncbi:MAG: hypothetical protein D8H93_14750 [Capnocytophaga sp.]|nr:MAG: hypothetical protein D8H93_14750 [Capnocytophaga sp.]
MELKDLRETLELTDKTDNLVVMDNLVLKILENLHVELKDLREALELTDKTDSLVVMDRMGIPLILVRMATGG